VQVFFSEPVARVDKAMSHVGSRIQNLIAIEPPSDSARAVQCLKATVAPFGPSFPNVAGSIQICFTKELSDTGATLTMLSVSGLEPNIRDGAGVHVHEGTSCDTSDTQGSHYFKNGVDPWLPTISKVAPTGANYSTEQAVSTTTFQFDMGYGYDNAVGKVVVVHASNGDRIACGVLGPVSHTTLQLNSAESGYLSAPLPSYLSQYNSNRPLLITGFLDFGDWGEGDAPKTDLQYTFSTQSFSTNPSDDWKNFFHNFGDMQSYTAAYPDDKPFAIALRNYGPPYEVVVRGVSDTTVIDVCVYEGNGSNRKVGCESGTTEGKNHIMIESIVDTETLNPCETYFALANTTTTEEGTGKTKKLWSSTSVTWNGPCGHSSRPQEAVIVASTKGNISPIVSSGIGFLICVAMLILLKMTRSKINDSQTKVEHSKINSMGDDEELASYTDNITTETMEMT